MEMEDEEEGEEEKETEGSTGARRSRRTAESARRWAGAGDNHMAGGHRAAVHRRLQLVLWPPARPCWASQQAAKVRHVVDGLQQRCGHGPPVRGLI